MRLLKWCKNTYYYMSYNIDLMIDTNTKSGIKSVRLHKCM